MDGMKAIAAKMVQVMGQIKFVSNDARNNEQNYAYASDEAILHAVKAAMVACNVCSFPIFTILSNTDGASNSGKKYNKVEMECKITVIDADSGETLESNGFGAGIDYGGDKALMKAQTVCHKYALQKLFNMPTGNNPEADEEVDREAARNQVKATTPANTNKRSPASPAQQTPCSESQQRKIETLWQGLGKTEAALKVELKNKCGVDSITAVGMRQAVDVIKSLEALKNIEDTKNTADGAEAGSAERSDPR